MDKPGTTLAIQSVHSWYFEAKELKKAMLSGLGLMHKNIVKLHQDVHTDPLTGLGNRRHLDVAVASLTANQTSFSVVAIDIDNFKNVNDTFGHDMGDTVLTKLATQMRENSRGDDVLCRLGGEEFVMLLPDASPHDAAQVAERLRHLVEVTDFPVVGRVTISQGVSNWPDSSTDIDVVFKKADSMLYVAKRAGRNRVEVSPRQADASDSAVVD